MKINFRLATISTRRRQFLNEKVISAAMIQLFLKEKLIEFFIRFVKIGCESKVF